MWNEATLGLVSTWYTGPQAPCNSYGTAMPRDQDEPRGDTSVMGLLATCWCPRFVRPDGDNAYRDRGPAAATLFKMNYLVRKDSEAPFSDQWFSRVFQNALIRPSSS